MHIENVIMIINVRNKCKLVEDGLSKKLEDMSLEELWQLFPIFLVKYNKEWAHWYDEEATAILSLIPAKYIVRISHIGSTAVQNIWAKNIVDILLEVRLAEELEIVKNILVENNWLCMSQSTRRISLNKGYTEQGFAIQIYTEDFKNDYISLTDIARYKNVHEPKDVVKNWLRVRDTIEFLGLWETIHNPNFKGVEFDSFRKEAGTNAFTLSPQRWIKNTNAIGIVSKSGRGGGTFAHPDIAMEFASWISAEFKLYLIQDYKRLKLDENSKLSLGWNLNREISKINYKIHTDAIKEYLLKDLTNEQLSYKYASEADMLNVALFNKRAKQWREENLDLKGNMRDYASLNELLVLANMESYNAILIGKGMEQKERMIELRKLARTQIVSLEKLNKKAIKKLEYFDDEKNK